MVTGLVPHVGGPIVAPGCPTVLIAFLPAARVTDMAVCVGPPDMIAMGSPTVLIGGLMAARIGDPTVHGGVIVMGAPTVMIGEVGMGSPAAVMVSPGGGGGGGGGAAPGSGPAETGGEGISAGQHRDDPGIVEQFSAITSRAMQFLGQAMKSPAAQALAASAHHGTPFIEPCPG